jgi:DNA-directed RNA polymerase subunit H
LEKIELDTQVLKHILVPKHEILTDKEISEITEKYNSKPNQFPYILGSDPVVRAIEAKPGDLIKITRKSVTAQEFIYYRYVVKG